MAMTNSDKLHVEPTPVGWTAYYDPEGLHGDGAALVDALEDLLEQTDEAWRKALDERDAARRALSEGVQKWIPAGERMPPPGKPVFAYFKNELGNGRTARAEWIAQWSQPYEGEAEPEEVGCEENAAGDWYIQEGWWESPVEAEDAYRLSGTVTHWMPLPEAPK
jgi:hypothetical protein